MYEKFKSTKMIILLSFAFIFIINVYGLHAQYQYSQAEIDLAIKRLEQRGLLETLVNKSSDDPKQVAIRADILIASYQIIRELDNLKETGATGKSSQVALLQNSIDNLKLRVSTLEEQGGASAGDSELINKIFSEIDTYLNNSLSIKGFQNSIKSLEKQDVTLEEKIKLIETKFDKLAFGDEKNLDKKIKNTKIMAATSLLVTLIVSILAAR